MRLIPLLFVAIIVFVSGISGCNSQPELTEASTSESVITTVNPADEPAVNTTVPPDEPDKITETATAAPAEDVHPPDLTVKEILVQVETQLRRATSSIYELVSNGWDILQPGDILRLESLWAENKNHTLLSLGGETIEEYKWSGHYQCRRTNDSKWEFNELAESPALSWPDEIWQQFFTNDWRISLSHVESIRNQQCYVLFHQHMGDGLYFNNEEVTVWVSSDTMLPVRAICTDLISDKVVTIEYLSWNEPIVIDIPEYVAADPPGIPVLLSPETNTMFAFTVNEEAEDSLLSITFEWEAGDGGTPTSYRFEAEYTWLVESEPFGNWTYGGVDGWYIDITDNTTGHTMNWPGPYPGRWRVAATNEDGGSDWSEWAYFGCVIVEESLMSGLGSYKFIQYELQPAFEAGDIIGISGFFWAEDGNTNWYIQLIDPDGNIERTWSTCSPNPFERMPADSIDVEYELLKSGTYSLRLTNPITTAYLRFQIFVNPACLDISTMITGIARTGVAH